MRLAGGSSCAPEGRRRRFDGTESNDGVQSMRATAGVHGGSRSLAPRGGACWRTGLLLARVQRGVGEPGAHRRPRVRGDLAAAAAVTRAQARAASEVRVGITGFDLDRAIVGTRPR